MRESNDGNQSKVLTLRPRMKAGEDFCGIQEENVVRNEGQVVDDEIADDGREERREIMAWATYDGVVPVMKALRSILRWRTTSW